MSKPDVFHGLSDGMPDCVLDTHVDHGVKYLTSSEGDGYTTLKLDKDAITYLKSVIVWAEQNNLNKGE